MKRLLPVLMGFVVLLLSSTEGWSLPPCPGSPSSNFDVYRYWTNCEGTAIHRGGRRKYVGAFKSGKRHGQGTYTGSDGRVKEGILRELFVGQSWSKMMMRFERE